MECGWEQSNEMEGMSELYWTGVYVGGRGGVNYPLIDTPPP